MSMLEWARREVEIACNKEHEDIRECAWEYGRMCYESALKAYESLCGDEHSGMSWGFTVGILKRLMDNKPLTPIEDTEDVWRKTIRSPEMEYETYQCIRKSSLFKDVYPDGRIVYTDVNRVICEDRLSGSTYTNGFIRKLIDKMFPIEMPYTADVTYTVICSDYLTDGRNGDFDTIAIWKVIDSNGVETEINRWFKSDECDGSWLELDADEFVERLYMHARRIASETEEMISNDNS